ncbi:hypothetical protein DB345_06000 [Spartobacteria bacterium LR76]|nr:hypothetical protein DB345_06000 [Spartobacteria bacterium LR76]
MLDAAKDASKMTIPIETSNSIRVKAPRRIQFGFMLGRNTCGELVMKSKRLRYAIGEVNDFLAFLFQIPTSE